MHSLSFSLFTKYSEFLQKAQLDKHTSEIPGRDQVAISLVKLNDVFPLKTYDVISQIWFTLVYS